MSHLAGWRWGDFYAVSEIIDHLEKFIFEWLGLKCGDRTLWCYQPEVIQASLDGGFYENLCWKIST